MKSLVLDVETKTTATEKGIDGSPYNPNNYLVSMGWCFIENKIITPVKYICCKHNYQATTNGWQNALQEALDEADVFIAHNAKYDLSWLYECGFNYDKTTYDTMIAEYVMARGRRMPFNLSACCARHGLPVKDDAEVKKYLSQGIGYEAMPWDVVEGYGRTDVTITAQLYLKQQEALES